MISEQAQIQALLNGIDEVLNKTSPRLPWVMSNDAAQQRQILEQTRQYLISLQQHIATGQLALPSGEDAVRSSDGTASSQSPSESAQQVLQAVLQEMNYWRVNMLQPLRTEVDSLQRQREMLTQEIRQLEAQRQQHTLGAQPNQQLLVDFLQSAMAQMQANLSGQMTQMVRQMQAGGQPALSGSMVDPQSEHLSPAERLQQLQQAQAQSDQLMLKLDSTLQVIFESLNRNVQTYEESLEQGLSRMHSLGQQGEAMFAFLVNRLAQQLGREASTFLQASVPNWQASSAPLPAPESQSQPLASESPAASSTTTPTEGFLSQTPDFAQSPTYTPAVPFDLSEEVLDIAELEQSLDPSAQLEPPSPNNTLEGLDFELSQLDLSAIPPLQPEVPPLDLFSGDQPLPIDSDHSAPEPQSVSEPFPAMPAIVSDLDSALDLLNQLSAEIQAGTAMQSAEPPAPPPTTRSTETEPITIPDSLYSDAFYQNLFEEPIADQALSDLEAADEDTTDAMTLEQEWFDGLGDPAVEQPSPATQPDFSSSPVNQSLENFLLSNPAPAASSPDLFAEFAEQFEGQAATSLGQSNPQTEPEPSPSEIITSLTDLVPPAAFSSSDLSLEPELFSDPLPIAEAPIEDFSVDWSRNSVDALTQFGVDLKQETEVPPQPTETGWDLFEELPTAEPSALQESDSNPPTATIEELEGLFEDVPNLEPNRASATSAENSPPIEATPDLFAQLHAAFSQDSGMPISPDSPDTSEAEKKK